MASYNLDDIKDIAVYLKKYGMSPTDIQQYLFEKYNYRISLDTIKRWVAPKKRKYTKPSQESPTKQLKMYVLELLYEGFEREEIINLVHETFGMRLKDVTLNKWLRSKDAIRNKARLYAIELRTVENSSYTQILEGIKETFGLSISTGTLYQWLKTANLIQPRHSHHTFNKRR